MQRLDKLLLQRELCRSRNHAQRLIEEGMVEVDATIQHKAGKLFHPNVHIQILGNFPYVNRAGEKLAACLKAFSLTVSNLNALDIGASTGGFTDCLLQSGASHVTCIDVGHGQLHPLIAGDKRVTSIEGVNARYLDTEILPYTEYSLVVIDVSFISLSLILPVVWPIVCGHGMLIALIKPQFEVGKKDVTRSKGVVKDNSLHIEAVENIIHFVKANLPNAQEIGRLDSPLPGSDGNREFFVGWRKICT